MALATRRRNSLLTGPLPSPKCALEWTTLTTGHSNRLTSRQIRSMHWSLVVSTMKHRWDATRGRVCWRAAPCRWTATGRVSTPKHINSRSESASSPTRRTIATHATLTSGSAAAVTPALETGLTGTQIMATGTPQPLVTSWCSRQAKGSMLVWTSNSGSRTPNGGKSHIENISRYQKQYIHSPPCTEVQYSNTIRFVMYYDPNWLLLYIFSMLNNILYIFNNSVLITNKFSWKLDHKLILILQF